MRNARLGSCDEIKRYITCFAVTIVTERPPTLTIVMYKLRDENRFLQELNRAVLDLENLVDLSASRALGVYHDDLHESEVPIRESSLIREMQANNRQTSSLISNTGTQRNRYVQPSSCGVFV